MERIYENEMEFGKKLVKMESQICDFVNRLEEGEYKVIYITVKLLYWLMI